MANKKQILLATHKLLFFRENRPIPRTTDLKEECKSDLTRTEQEVNGPDAQQQEDKYTAETDLSIVLTWQLQ